jgi:hypothetical protein
MGLRDSELKRLEQYGKSLGVTISYARSSATCSDDGYFAIIGKKAFIEVYRDAKSPKIQLILTLLHEIAHYLSWVYRNRKNSKLLNKALEAETARNPGDPPIAKSLRKQIYELEKHDVNYQDLIVKELNLKIDKITLETQKKIDKWIYLRYYKTGHFPDIDLIIKKRSDIYAKEKRKKL